MSAGVYLHISHLWTSEKKIIVEYLLRTNLTFQLLLNQLVSGQKLDKKNKLVSSLDLAAKYELVRMKSKGELQFQEGTIYMTQQGLERFGELPTLCQMVSNVG